MEHLTRDLLRNGGVIPAHPLALDAERRLDESRQRGLTRHYLSAGVTGLAVGVHTTQFEIRRPDVGLYEPVLRMAAEELDAADRPVIRIAGLCGPTQAAVAEAETASMLGYDAGLLSMAGWGDAPEADLLAGVRAVAEVLPIFGFYLQPAVGGRLLSYDFWCRFLEIPQVCAVKIAAFDRYRTIDVARALCAVGRSKDVALYTGNDDSIVVDLVTPFRFPMGGETHEVRIVGGLLGQWSVWTEAAVELHRAIAALPAQSPVPAAWLSVAAELTDANGALFDAANGFRGCIAGINEVLHRQGLLAGRWCLDPGEDLSPGQAEEIDRVIDAYPHLVDGAVMRDHLASIDLAV